MTSLYQPGGSGILAPPKTISNFCDNEVDFVATKTLSPIQFSKKVAGTAAISRELPLLGQIRKSTRPFGLLATLQCRWTSLPESGGPPNDPQLTSLFLLQAPSLKDLATNGVSSDRTITRPLDPTLNRTSHGCARKATPTDRSHNVAAREYRSNGPNRDRQRGPQLGHADHHHYFSCRCPRCLLLL